MQCHELHGFPVIWYQAQLEHLVTGVYNETAFAALDYILDTAAYNGVKVIFTMGDNWQYADAKRNVSWLFGVILQWPLEITQTELLHDSAAMPACIFLCALLRCRENAVSKILAASQRGTKCVVLKKLLWLQYNTWAGFDESSDDFWTSTVTKQMYKNHMKVMVERVNSLNGKCLYKRTAQLFAQQPFQSIPLGEAKL